MAARNAEHQSRKRSFAGEMPSPSSNNMMPHVKGEQNSLALPHKVCTYVSLNRPCLTAKCVVFNHKILFCVSCPCIAKRRMCVGGGGSVLLLGWLTFLFMHDAEARSWSTSPKQGRREKFRIRTTGAARNKAWKTACVADGRHAYSDAAVMKFPFAHIPNPN
jgi:hypothetical protein